MSFEEVERNGWTMQCPNCNKDNSYTLINNQYLPVPFFYAEDCNDVLLRKKDQELADQILETADETPDIKNLTQLWEKILHDAPPTRYGGKYTLWANVKCPHCSYEIPYNNGVENLELRIYEPKIVLIDGASIVGESVANSWNVRVVLGSVT